MGSTWKINTGRIAAFPDIGTNSIRLLMVRINPNHSFTILSSQKEIFRLGEEVLTRQELPWQQPDQLP